MIGFVIVWDYSPYLRQVPFAGPLPQFPQQSSAQPRAQSWSCPAECLSCCPPMPNQAALMPQTQRYPSQWALSFAANPVAQARRQAFCLGLVRLGQLERTAWPY